MSLQLNIKKGTEKSSTDETITAVPMFLWKLVHLLKEPASQPYISWNEDGTSFTVRDQANFSKLVLPKYFKHNKFSSFVRQLNIYGFRKAAAIQQGVVDGSPEAVEFYHPYFREDNLEMLQLIKRKVHTVIPKATSDEIDQVLHDVHEVKDSQKKISGSLTELKQENESLWREVVSLRQKHSQQQKVVNHLIKFLVSIVQHHGMGTKRRYPLMIDEGSSSTAPAKKMSRQSSQIMFEPVVTTPIPGIVIDQPQENSPSAEGPLITELLSTAASPTVPQKVGKDLLLTPSPNPDPDPDSFDISELMQFPEISDQQVADSVTNVLDLSQTEKANVFVPVNSSSTTSEVVEPSAYLNLPPTSQSNQQRNRTDSTSPRQSPTVSSASALAIPSVSTDQHGAIDNLNFDMDKITNNLQNIKSRLSSNDQIQLEYDMLQELFNGSADLSPTPNFYDYSLPMNVPQPEGNELVQYTRDNLLPNSSIGDGSDLDYNEILDSLKD